MMTLILIFLAWFVAPAWAQDNWEKEWNQVLLAAKKEGTVAVMNSAGGTEPRKALTDIFQKKYGINVEYFSSSGVKMISRIKAERSAGQYLWDVFIGGTSPLISSLKPDRSITPIEPALILPEVKEGKNWLGGKLEFADSDRTILVLLSYSKSAIFINTDLVNPDEFKSIKDLLRPKWTDKILAGDPRVPGPGQATFSYFYGHKELGPDFIRALAKQNLHLLRDLRQSVEWLAAGKYPILVGGPDTEAEPFLKQNLPIRIINPKQLKEGGYLTAGPGSVSLLAQPAHPNAAKVYLNWLSSKEGQAVLVEAVGYPSRRLDVAKPPEPWKFPPDLGYWVSYDEAAVTEIKVKLVPMMKEIFGE